jgi:hypothetical protein
MNLWYVLLSLLFFKREGIVIVIFDNLSLGNSSFPAIAFYAKHLDALSLFELQQ